MLSAVSGIPAHSWINLCLRHPPKARLDSLQSQREKIGTSRRWFALPHTGGITPWRYLPHPIAYRNSLRDLPQIKPPSLWHLSEVSWIHLGETTLWQVPCVHFVTSHNQRSKVRHPDKTNHFFSIALNRITQGLLPPTWDSWFEFQTQCCDHSC